MSATIVDMPKVTQMLDSGWTVGMFKNGMGSYTAYCYRAPGSGKIKKCPYGLPDNQVADDFTPEQVLTRLAYKVHGEII